MFDATNVLKVNYNDLDILEKNITSTQNIIAELQTNLQRYFDEKAALEQTIATNKAALVATLSNPIQASAG